MLSRTGLLSALALASSAWATITSISVPSGSFAPGSTIPVTFNCRNSLSGNEQLGVVFGLSPQPFDQGAIGTQIDWIDLRARGYSHNGGSELPSFVLDITLPDTPATQKADQMTLNAGVYGIIGAGGGLTEQVFNATVPIQHPERRRFVFNSPDARS